MRFLLHICLIVASGISVFAQSPASAPTPIQKSQSPDQIQQENIRKQQDDQLLKNGSNSSIVPDKTNPNPANLPPLRPQPPHPSAIKPNEEQARRLLPSLEDSTQYAVFLKQPNTKLIRLFTDLDCTDKYVVRVDNPCLDNIPLSSFYSFRKKNYSEKGLSDIRLKDNSFFTEGLLSNSLIVVLGDIPLDSVSIGSNGMNFLAEYRPANKSEEIWTKSEELAKGIRAENFTYAKTAPVLEHMTYAIRVIAYRGKIPHPLGKGFFYDELEGDKRTDIIGVFRIVRKENGSLTLLWKELQRKDAPKIKLSKEENTSLGG